MNDAVGGVEVTVLQDISFPKAGVDLKKGEKVTLDGTQAYYYRAIHTSSRIRVMRPVYTPRAPVYLCAFTTVNQQLAAVISCHKCGQPSIRKRHHSTASKQTYI